MQKVITISLNGNAYQLDEAAYDALRAYLDHAETQLGDNPDCAEIVRDVEQAIGDKCQRVLGPGKSVVSLSEITDILREIGPIDPGANGASWVHMTTPSPRRLYQIREGAMLSGVCNGLGAYFNADPTIVRVAFIAAGVLEMSYFDRPPFMTIGLYVLLMFLVPYAKTSGERAAAHGAARDMPFRIQSFVERVKARFTGPHPKPR